MSQFLTPDMTATEWMDVEQLELQYSVDVARIASEADEPEIQKAGKELLVDAERELAQHVADPEGPKVAIGYLSVQARNRIRALARETMDMKGPAREEAEQEIALEWVRHGVKGQRNLGYWATREILLGNRPHTVVDDRVLDLLGAFDLVHPIRAAVVRYNVLELKKKVRSSLTPSAEKEILIVSGAAGTRT